MSAVLFTKGHGTENDFVLVPDLDGSRPLSPDEVRLLADRHAGLGADGVIRVVPTAQAAEPEVRHQAMQATWFMDYHNADGSPAEMCGNGSRVFAAYLRREGLVDDDEFLIATRGGPKVVTVLESEAGTEYATDLGPWRVVAPDFARGRGVDVTVRPKGGPQLPGLRMDLGNPHTVVLLPEGLGLEALDLSEPPAVSPAPEQGTNVEFVRVLGHRHIAMRVHERGVGETRSCGTGAAAAALATQWWQGTSGDGADWVVDVPGGRVRVRALPTGHVELAGPAVLVADGSVILPDGP